MADTWLEMTLGTATAGGGFPPFGEALASTVGDVDPALSVRCRATRGSAENLPLVERGELDLALVQGEALHQALERGADVSIVSAMYAQAGLFCVPADSPCRRVADLAGRRVALGVPSSGLVLLAHHVLSGVGMDAQRDLQAVYLEKAGDGALLLGQGRVDALWGAGAGWPGFVEVLRSMAARLVAPDAGERRAILARHAFLQPVTLPAGSYEGQHEPLASVGSWSFVLARRSLDEQAAYRLARALHRGQSMLAARLPAAREATLANTAAHAPPGASIHPGVMRFMREAGIAA